MRNQLANYLTYFADHLTAQYGERGTTAREEFEEGFESFKLGAMLQELHKGKDMDRAQTADKYSINK